jgi:hypothetical protein
MIFAGISQLAYVLVPFGFIFQYLNFSNVAKIDHMVIQMHEEIFLQSQSTCMQWAI